MSSLHNGHAAAVKERLVFGRPAAAQAANTLRNLPGLARARVAGRHDRAPSASPRQAAEVMQVPMALVRTIRQATRSKWRR